MTQRYVNPCDLQLVDQFLVVFPLESNERFASIITKVPSKSLKMLAFEKTSYLLPIAFTTASFTAHLDAKY